MTERTRDSVATDLAQFLSAGGCIQRIPDGATGLAPSGLPKRRPKGTLNLGLGLGLKGGRTPSYGTAEKQSRASGRW